MITTSGMTFAHAATLLARHLADHALPDPVSLSVTTSYGDSTATAQLRGDTVPGIASDLIAWADTLSVVTVEAWRPSERDRVHLSIRGTLTGPAGAVELKVFGAVDYDPFWFADLQTDQCKGVSLALGQLRTWAANPSTTTDTVLVIADTTLVVSHWEFAGQGYLTNGDTALALSAAVRAREQRNAARDAA